MRKIALITCMLLPLFSIAQFGSKTSLDLKAEDTIFINGSVKFYQNDVGQLILEDIENTNIALSDLTEGGSALGAYSIPYYLGSGTSLSDGTVRLAALSDNDVAYLSELYDELRTYRWNGHAGVTWTQIGSGLDLGNVGSSFDIARLNDTDVAYVDHINDQLRTYRWNGSTWSQVGNSLTIPGSVSIFNLTALSDTSIVMYKNPSVSGELQAYKFDGTDWTVFGNPLSVSNATADLESMTQSDFAYVSTVDSIRMYRFNGTDITQLGNDYYIGFDLSGGDFGVASLNSKKLIFGFGGTFDKVQIYDFDDTDWNESSGFAYIQNISDICSISGSTFALFDSTADRLYMFLVGNSSGQTHLRD